MHKGQSYLQFDWLNRAGVCVCMWWGWCWWIMKLLPLFCSDFWQTWDTEKRRMRMPRGERRRRRSSSIDYNKNWSFCKCQKSEYMWGLSSKILSPGCDVPGRQKLLESSRWQEWGESHVQCPPLGDCSVNRNNSKIVRWGGTGKECMHSTVS